MKGLAIACLLALGAAAGTSAAQGSFYVERGSWWVGAIGKRCMAASRPGVEGNVFPLGTLMLSRTRGQAGTGVQVAFWPGAFEPGQRIELLMSRSGEGVSLPATATEHFMAVADRALDPAEVRALAQEGDLAITVEGLPAAVGVRMLPDLGTLSADLASCLRVLPEE